MPDLVRNADFYIYFNALTNSASSAFKGWIRKLSPLNACRYYLISIDQSIEVKNFDGENAGMHGRSP